MLNRLTFACASALSVIALWGCTLAEWGQVGEDALEAAPQVAIDAITNPNPVGWAVLAVTFLSGLIAKSAARGFGKGAAYTGSTTYKAILAVLTKLGLVKTPPAE